MQNWEIIGLEKESGEEIRLKVLGADHESASRTAMGYGIIVKSVHPWKDDIPPQTSPSKQSAEPFIPASNMFRNHPIWTIALGIILAQCLMAFVALIIWMLAAQMIIESMQ